jgi:hypothetical protein
MALTLGAGPALAVLTPIIPISGTGSTPRAWDGAIAADGSHIYVVYREAGAILIRRSTDTGATFEPPVTLSDPGTIVSDASTAAAGSVAHVTWRETAGDGSQRVLYRRSTDGGATWAPAIALTPTTTTQIRSPHVFAAGVRVFLAYVDVNAQRLRLRRSTTQGASFAAAADLGTASTGQHVSMAFGYQVMYIAWESSLGNVRLRRSTTGGITWGPGVTLGARGGGHSYGRPWLAAAGRSAILAMSRSGNPRTIVVRLTTDKGVTWQTSRRVSPLDMSAFTPVIQRTAGRWLIAFSLCNPFDCEFWNLAYRTSSDGVRWGYRYRLQSESGPIEAKGVASTADGTTWFASLGDSGAGDGYRVSIRGVK